MTEDVEISMVTQKTSAQIRNQSAIPNFDQSSPFVELDNIGSHVVYRFIYNDNLSQQTEACDDFMCPWCYLNCIRLEPLLMHLRLCHERFKFSVAQKEYGVLIDVKINHNYQCSLSGPIKKENRHSIGLQRRIPLTKVLVARKRSDVTKYSDLFSGKTRHFSKQI